MFKPKKFKSIGGLGVSILGIISTLQAVSCSTEIREQHSTYAFQSQARQLRFEKSKHWIAGANTKLENDTLLSEGEFSLSVIHSGTASFRSAPSAIAGAIERVGFDLRTNDEQSSSDGTVEVAITCPSLGIDEQTVGAVGLSSVSTGRFETVSFELEENLQEALSKGCDDLSVQFGIFAAQGDDVLTFDRLEFNYEFDTETTPLCGTKGQTEAVDDELSNGYLRRHAWRSGLSTQLELARIQDALNEEPEILGFAAEDLSKQFIIVIDSSTNESLENLAKRWALLRPTIPYRLQYSCRDRGELKADLDVIRRESLAQDARSLTYSLDPSTSQFNLLLDPQDSKAGQKILDSLKDTVTIEYRAAGEHDRMTDGQPHYGAAAIENLTAGRACTAGFVVNKGAAKGAVTAGHCADVTNEYFYSNSVFWGETTASGWPSSTTSWDMVYIGPSVPAQTYSAKIHTDPCCPLSRPVTTKVPPAVSQIVCITGRIHKAKCTVEVFKKEPTFVINGKTRKNVWFGRRTGVNIAAEGDSGAPIYIPVGAGNAAIVGMHIAGFLTAPFDQTWFHSVTDIEAQLGVTVAY